MASVNSALADRAVDHAINVLRFERGVVNRLIALLNRTDARLMAALSEALLRLDPSSFTVDRLERLLGSVRELNDKAVADMFRELRGEMRELAGIEAQAQYGFMRGSVPAPVLLQFAANRIGLQNVYAAALSRPFQGRLLSGWAKEVGDARMRLIRNAITSGFVEGRTTADIIRTIRGTKANNYRDGVLDRSRREVAAVVQTALSHTAQTARAVFYDANKDLIKALQWVSTLDNKTTPQCFPESTLALPVGDLRGVFRRKWDGDLVVVTTASGKKLRATPNHPVLTARGWRAIKEVEPGKDVLYRVMVDVGAIVPAKDVEVPAPMGALFDALREPAVAHVFSERSSEVDFHGDGVVGDYEVNNPRSKRHLRLALDAAFGHEAAEKFLVLVAASSRLSDLGKMDEFGFRSELIDMASQADFCPIQDRIQAILADLKLPANLNRLDAFHEAPDYRGLVASACLISAPELGHYAGPFEKACDGGRSDPVVAPDLGGGDSVGVFADDVVSVDREFFSGHVCNLSTSTQLYIADGFVVHNCMVRDGLTYTQDYKPIGHGVPWGAGPGRLHFNCRSVSVPVLKSWRELGIDVDDLPPSVRAAMDGEQPADMTFGQWFARQPAARQNEIVGAERAELFRTGKVTFEGFSDDKGKWLSLPELRALIP